MDTPVKADVRRLLDQYNDEMSVSQVARFFERQGVLLTKTMIQNYARKGLLPHLVDKHFYTRDHLFLLAIIEDLKDDYSLEEIKSLFEAVSNADPADLYARYREMYEAASAEWSKKFGESQSGMDVLGLMAQNTAFKRMISLSLAKGG